MTQPGSSSSSPSSRQEEIVDQSDDVRDPADDSGEIDDPTAMTDTYPAAFDERIEQAEAAIATHDPHQDRRSTAGNGRSRDDEAAGLR